MDRDSFGAHDRRIEVMVVDLQGDELPYERVGGGFDQEVAFLLLHLRAFTLDGHEVFIEFVRQRLLLQ